MLQTYVGVLLETPYRLSPLIDLLGLEMNVWKLTMRPQASRRGCDMKPRGFGECGGLGAMFLQPFFWVVLLDILSIFSPRKLGK